MIFINDKAYDEFKELLDKTKSESYNVRIYIDRIGCNGPIFGICHDVINENDDVDKIKDINFVVEKTVNQEFGGFIIVSREENNGKNLGLKPIVQSVHDSGNKECNHGCGGCGGCK